MNGAIIGFGTIASNGHAPALLKMDRHAIVGVVDPVEERRRAAQKMIPGVRTFTSLEELLSADLELDFIDVASPPCFHLEQTLAAAERGLHVLCEKPITTSMEQARAMLLAAREHQVSIFPCHNYKHAPVVKAMRSLVTSGHIGKVRSATLTTFRTTNAKGTSDWVSDWRRMRRYSGGGIAMDHGSHSCYLTFMFFSGAAPRSVSARTYQLSTGEFDTEDNLCCTLTFDDGFAQIHLSWTAGVRKVIYALHGSDGAVIIEDDQARIFKNSRIERKSVASGFDDSSHTEWFSSMFEDFARQVDQRNHVTSELKEAYLCMATIDAIYRSSSRGGQEVEIDADLSFL